MAIVKMSHMTLICENRNQSDVLNELMWLEAVDVVPLEDRLTDEAWKNLLQKDGRGEKGSEYAELAAQLKTAADILSPFSEKKRSIFSKPHILGRKDFDEFDSIRDNIVSLCGSVLDTDRELASLKLRENKLINTLESLKPWSVIDTDINRPLTKYTKLILGVVPLTEFNGSFESVYEKNENIYIEKINEDNEYLYIAVVCLRNEEEDAYAALASVHFSSVNFKDLEGSPEDNSILIKEQLGQISDKRSELADKLRRAAEKLPDIEKAYDIVNNISNTFSVRERLLKTNNTFILEGWCPVKRVDEVNKLADKYGCYCEFRDPEDSEEPPILLKNNAFAAPFESVTAMYALPTYRGLDPDFVMAPFYFILFGLMLGDAGYGAIISIACFLGLKLCHFREGMRRNLKMFFLCGLSTVFWGIMFGSFFGDVIPVFSETFLGSRANFNPVWFSPIDQPLTLLVFSFGIGYLHIMCGLLMKAFMLIRDKKVMDAIFDVGFWVLVLTGLPLFALAYILGLSQLIVNIGLVITVIGVAGLIFTQGRDKKNPVMKLLGGIMSLYDITGFVSDILSYSRVLALGLSTSIIGSVFNKLATLLGGGIPGFILFTVIFLLGSALNIALNTLGSYVHASRLQFIEFFSKFYESGGRPYEALKVDTKYSEIK